jgi:copper chaperone/mercuric ion binding protein
MAREPAGGELSEIEFSVPSMVCIGCADKIRRKLTALAGVEAVKPRLWRKRVRVRFDPSKVEDAQIRAALDAVGYRAARISE